MARRSISKLYIPGACADTRENNFGFSSLNPTHLNCDTVDNYSQDTCNLVFKQGENSFHFPASGISFGAGTAELARRSMGCQRAGSAALSTLCCPPVALWLNYVWVAAAQSAAASAEQTHHANVVLRPQSYPQRTDLLPLLPVCAAPASAIVTNLTTDEAIESEDVCWPAHVGFIFVKNNCTNACQVAVNVSVPPPPLVFALCRLLPLALLLSVCQLLWLLCPLRRGGAPGQCSLLPGYHCCVMRRKVCH